MVRKISKLCMAVAFAACISIPAHAADPEVSVAGEISAGLLHTTEDDSNDSYSFTDMYSEATIEVEGSIQLGQWTTSGFASFELTDDGVGATNRFITLENNTFALSLGNYEFDSDEITLGKDYLDIVDESIAFGVSALEDGGGDYLKLNLKETGLQFALGINDMNDESADLDNDGENDSIPYTETTISALYGGEFGDLAINAVVTAVSESVETDREALSEDGEHDGKSKTEAAIAAQYTLDNMAFALNIDQYVVDSGEDSAEEETTLSWEFAFDLGLGDDSGITVSYGQATVDDGTDDDTEKTALHVGYMRPIGAAIFTVGYSLTTEENDDDNIDNTNTIIGGGLTFAF